MSENKYLVIGIAAIVILYGATLISIYMSPWFDWWNNALSDLGHLKNTSAPIFNGGLFFAGFFVLIYGSFKLRSYAPITSYFLALSGLSLQLVGLFCENYGRLHFYVSVLLFITLFLTSVCYTYERRSRIALFAILMIPLWWLYFGGGIFNGAAIPEVISSLLILPWYLNAILRANRFLPRRRNRPSGK